LSYCKKGFSADRAASKGLKKASHKIFIRTTMDGMSALVYLATGKKDSFKAVWKAHNEFTEMHAGPKRNDLAAYLNKYGKKASVNGIYRKWIVLQAFLHGRDIFSHIPEKVKNI
jgi:hypothetical protein